MITSIKDGYGDIIDKYLKRHEVLVLLVCLVSFIVGIPYIFKVSSSVRWSLFLKPFKSFQRPLYSLPIVEVGSDNLEAKVYNNSAI